MIRELFMSYNYWFKYKGLNKKYYNDDTVRMLYSDRWLVQGLPLLILIICFFVIVQMWRKFIF